jgi:CBS domain-containing protein
MKAGELCVRNVVTALADESLVDAARRMSDMGVGDLVVVEESASFVRPVGIVTDRDLVTRALASGDTVPARLSVRDVMQPAPVLAAEDDDVDQVLTKLEQNAIRRIPIVDRAGSLQGILALDDIITWISEMVSSITNIVDRQTRRPMLERVTPH